MDECIRPSSTATAAWGASCRRKRSSHSSGVAAGRLCERRGVHVSLLGPTRVSIDARTIVLGGVKPRGLLARLALDAGRAVSVETLAKDLWGAAQPRSVNASLQ